MSLFLALNNRTKNPNKTLASCLGLLFSTACSSLVCKPGLPGLISPLLFSSIANVIQRAGCPVPDYIQHLPRLQRCVRLSHFSSFLPILEACRNGAGAQGLQKIQMFAVDLHCRYKREFRRGVGGRFFTWIKMETKRILDLTHFLGINYFSMSPPKSALDLLSLCHEFGF